MSKTNASKTNTKAKQGRKPSTVTPDQVLAFLKEDDERKAKEAEEKGYGIGLYYDHREAGRITQYDQAIADIIVKRVGAGESLGKICKQAPMPSATTVYDWEDSVSVFADALSRARRRRAKALADQSADITDELEQRVHTGQIVDFNMIRARTELTKQRTMTRQWVASKVDAAVFGDKPVLEQQQQAQDKYQGMDTAARLDKIKEIVSAAVARKDSK